MNSKSKTREETIIELLEERHLSYLNLTRENVKDKPFWRNTKGISRMEYSEWLEYGVNSVISVTGCDRTKAEMEMSWIESKYGIKVNNS